ncbi:restriction endonuclease subunit S [Bacteroides sp. LFL-34]|uniref:restriction endonuclease subunit S n=1 Tax=Bacteroides sp. LFL-34 TaxID=2994968 RepID=UPI0022B46ACF|nr:restriction endonuclease subunit S [Bacteroides sp. LFL-34]
MRFPEFSGEWKKCTIGELAIKVGSGVTPRGGESVYKMDGHPFVRSQNVGLGHLILDDIAFIDEETHLRQKSTELKLEDVLLNITGASIGRSALVNEQVVGGNVNQHVCIIRTKESLIPSFLCNFLLSNYGQRQIDSFQAGGNRQGLNFEQIKSIKIAIPSTKEQTKVAKLLQLIEERIATQNKIIEDLKKLKSAISKQVFAQEPNGWSRLDTLFSKGKAGGTPTSTNKEYYNGEIPFLSINDITKQGKYVRYTENHLSQSGLENSSAWVVPKYSLIMSMYASVGLVTINEIPITTSQAMFAMQLKDKDLLDYLYYYLSYFKYRHIHKYLETGTQSNINADIVRGIMIPTYGHSRNMEIASTLQDIDVKIDNELSVLKLFNRQKNYLLSQMFI